jgi:hypothetical protein
MREQNHKIERPILIEEDLLFRGLILHDHHPLSCKFPRRLCTICNLWRKYASSRAARGVMLPYVRRSLRDVRYPFPCFEWRAQLSRLPTTTEAE